MRGEDDKRYQALATWMRELRAKMGHSTGGFAKFVGRPQPWVWEVENGRRLPGIFDVVRVARAYHIRGHAFTNLIEGMLDDPTLSAAKAPRPPAQKPRAPLAPKAALRKRLQRQSPK